MRGGEGHEHPPQPPLAAGGPVERLPKLVLTSPPSFACAMPCSGYWRRASPLTGGRFRSQLTRLGLDKVVAMAERAITHKSDRFCRT